MIYLNDIKLSKIMKKVLTNFKVNKDSINHVVNSLVETSLRGVDSHGINLFPHYCRAISSGRINKNPDINISDTGVSTSSIDADHSFGHHVGAVAIDKAIKLSEKTGISAVNVKNSTHFGAASYFGLRAAEKNCLGFAFTNADALLKTFGSKEAFFGSNPICFTAPLINEAPLCLDMATTLVSWNKLENKKLKNLDIPYNWAFDDEGNSVTNPNEATSLNPIGEYKGYGLAMMVDILCGILAGSLSSKDILPMYTSSIKEKRYISHFFMAINIKYFIDVNVFKKQLQDIVDRLRVLPNYPTLLQDNPVMVPGDPEKQCYDIRIKEGIPIDEIKYEEFLTTSSMFKEVIE